MMRLLVALIFSISTASVYAKKGGNFGLGVLLGSPTALSGKMLLSRSEAIDGGLSFSGEHFMIFGDYLKHFPGAFGGKNAFLSELSPYVGIGPIFAFNTDKDHRHHRDFFHEEDDDFAFGGRIPFGIEWMTRNAPIGISLELVPGLVIIPKTDAFIQAGLAVRYYF